MIEQPPDDPRDSGWVPGDRPDGQQGWPPPGQPAPPSMAGPIWAGVGGVFANVPISVAVVFSQNGAVGVGAILFAALVFLGGGALCFVKSRPTRGFAVGLMTGWALLSITTAGFCTGLTDLHMG